MLPRAVQRLAAALGSAVVLVGMTWTGASGQGTTGKIQGRVVMAGTGTPVAAAQVTVEGTTFGNITNDDGFYFVNEVPAGVFDIRAQSIGYRATVLRNQRVLAGQTITLNFELEQAAVQLEALEVTGERNPLVPRDQVSSKAIVTGEEIDALPLDNANSIIVLQPGVISTNSGRTIRGSRPGEEAVYIDGVPIRRLRTGTVETTELPTNVLAQVDVVTGGIDARFGDAQSGVINYVTRTGGPTFGGTVAFLTDQTVKDWSAGFNRAEVSLGGPIPGINNLTFFVGGTAEGRSYANQNQGLVDDPGWWYATGTDTTFTLPRSSAVSGMTDSVTVNVPNYVRWDNGNRFATNQSDEYNLTAKLTYGLPRGGKVDLTYYRNRDQALGGNFYNPDAGNANYSSSNVVTLGTYFLLRQTAESQIAVDLKASIQRDWAQQGDITPEWRFDHKHPFLGFNFANIDFITDPDDYPVTDALASAIKSGVIPGDSLILLPGRGDLTGRQGVAGVGESLRLNPYGMRSGWQTQGIGNTAQAWQKENRTYLSGTVDWQMNRYNRLWFGGDVTKADAEYNQVQLYQYASAFVVPTGHFEPTRAGLYAQNRLDIGDVVLEAGLRWEYFDPGADWPRIPGFVFNVPDSLKRDFVRVQPGTGPLLDRLEPNSDCGGAATAPDRTNANGQVVCKDNFIKTDAKTTWSPRLAVSFPVTATSTFRFSYSHNTQVPSLTAGGGLIDDIYCDLQGCGNTNSTYGRDVDIPRTVLFEAGYRQVFGGNTVVDVAAYSKTTRNSLTYRKVQYEDPNTGGSIYVNSLTNADYSLARGVDLRLDRRFSDIADLSVNYSFVDARGTGSDPFTYTGIILRRNTNLSVLTGSPVDPPELLLALNQSRAHNVAGTLSLLFPADYREGEAIGTVLSDLGMFATMRFASGLPYTRFINDGVGQRGPPTAAGLGAIPAEQLNASRSPSQLFFDMRLVRGFRVGDNRLRLTADFRNPFHIANTNRVYLETGEITNALHREKQLDALLRDATLDGDGNIDDFRIMTESSDNELNKYMLLKAEERFGNGDGLFTVAEQKAAFGANYDLNNSPLRNRNANRSLRLGLEFIF